MSRIAGSFKTKIPSIIVVGSLAQFFLWKISRRIKVLLSSESQTKDVLISLQKEIPRLGRVNIIVNSVGFFLGPTITFIIYPITGSKSYPPFEMFFIIATHLMIGTVSSILQLSFIQITFQDILRSFHTYENIPELRTMGVTTSIETLKDKSTKLSNENSLLIVEIDGLQGVRKSNSEAVSSLEQAVDF